MTDKKLIGLEIIVVCTSVVAAQYIGNILSANFYARYSAVDIGDAALMMHGFLLGCIYLPLIAGGIGGIISILGWFAITKQTHRTLKGGFAVMVVVFIAAAIGSLLWFALTYFF